MSAPQAFKNPEEAWSYNGPFHVHITNEAHVDERLRQYIDVHIEGTLIRVGENGVQPGRIEKHTYGIQMFAGDQSFDFGFHNLIRLCRPSGQLIWQNNSLDGVVMQGVWEPPYGSWPMFYYDGERIIGQIGRFGGWYQLDVGQEVSFDRHGTFRFTKTFDTVAHLDVILPRKGWNPAPATCLLQIPTGMCLTVFRSNFYLERMDKTWLHEGFGYRPGHQPLREDEKEELLGMFTFGPLMEERAQKAVAKMEPKEARDMLKELRVAAERSELLRLKAEELKAKMSI